MRIGFQRVVVAGRHPSAPRDTAWKVCLAVGMAMVAGYFLIPSAEVQNLAYQVPSMLGTVAVLAGIALHRPVDSRPWLLLAAGLALTSIGDWTWVILAAQGLEPFPSLADAFYLGGVTLQVMAVVILLRGRVPGGDRAGLLDALIVAVGVGLVSWVFVMAPIVSDPAGSFAEIGIALAYPMLDIVMLGVVARLFFTRGRRRVPALEFIAAALIALVCADFGYAVLAMNDAYQTGQLVEAGWLLAAFLWATAALHPSMRWVAQPVEPGEVRFSPGRLAVLAGASLLAPAVLLVQWATGGPLDVPVIAAGCVVLFLLVIARLGIVLLELRATLQARRLLEAELQQRAHHDPLTGLANRALFHERLERALTRRGQRVAVMFLDVDDFKTVNDAYGHQAGDRVLCAVANALSGAVRSADTVARLGGDEFAVLLEDGPDVDAAGQVADRLLDAVRGPADIVGHEQTVGASIGIALGLSGAATADELMRQADMAMYAAKGNGKGGFTVFEPTMHADVAHGIELRADLHRAIREQRFELHYQPVIDLASGAVVGVEALARWRHPVRGLLAPMDFIPLAEATGAIVPLGRWIVEEACRQAMRWTSQDAEAASWFMGVNVSSVQLATPDFATAVSHALAGSGLPASRLVLEVTESAQLDGKAAAETLGDLDALGVRLAIDDFGTGYASLSALSRTTVRMVKIDRSFVAAIETDERAEALMAGLVELATRLGVTLVAEGIENREQLARLRTAGCPLGQGFFFLKPVPAVELRRLLSIGENAPVTAALHPDPVPHAPTG